MNRSGIVYYGCALECVVRRETFYRLFFLSESILFISAMSAGIMLINLRRILHRSFGARGPFLASLYHTQRGVYGFRPREIPEKDAGLPQISALNQG